MSCTPRDAHPGSVATNTARRVRTVSRLTFAMQITSRKSPDKSPQWRSTADENLVSTQWQHEKNKKCQYIRLCARLTFAMQITSRKYLAKVALHVTSMRAVRNRMLCAAYAALRSDTQCAVLKTSIHSLVLWQHTVCCVLLKISSFVGAAQALITRLGWAC